MSKGRKALFVWRNMNLLEAVERAKKKTRARGEVISWTKVAELMGNEKTPEQYRSLYRVHHLNIKDEHSKVKQTSDRNFKKGITEPLEILVSELSNERTIAELCYATSLTQIELLGHIEQLRLNGYDIVQVRIGDEVAYTTNKKVNTTYYEYKHYHDVDKVIKVGIVSDTHIGSRYWQKTFLQMAYDDFKQEGISNVYHVGDISDGMYTQRAGNIYEIYAFGFDEQVEEVVNVYPKVEGITTFFITGNHDATHQMNGGASIGKAIELRRPDLKYLGHEYAKIWLSDKVDIDLVHPRDGTSYALSYKLQKRIDAMQGGSKPKIMVVGHYHKNYSMLYRNIWAFGLASFQAQSPFMRGLGLVSDVGYLILELKINKKGDIIECTPRYKALYETIKESY
jgi:predicted phosphodiesterase